MFRSSTVVVELPYSKSWYCASYNKNYSTLIIIIGVFQMSDIIQMDMLVFCYRLFRSNTHGVGVLFARLYFSTFYFGFCLRCISLYSSCVISVAGTTEWR